MESETDILIPQLSVYISVFSCLLLSLIYVGSLYVWKSEHDRDHPSIVKKRFCSVFVVMLISPVFIYFFISRPNKTDITIWEMMGFRIDGILVAFIVPLLLTAVLFLGPISLQIHNGVWKSISEPSYWINNIQNILWLRNHVVAPLSEEFTFRACMMPLLLQSIQPLTAVLITPLFFGVAHLHHMIERLRSGMDFKTAFIISVFQLGYTGIFGMYSAYLFARTGHFIAPFMVHAFCNHMGFPDVSDLLSQPDKKKHLFFGFYVIGLISWIALLPIVTKPELYNNQLYWQNG